MKKLLTIRDKAEHVVYPILSALLLIIMSLPVLAQTGQGPSENPDRPSQSEQASAYLHSIEKDPNGVPNSSAWYTQPWIWAIVAAILILIIGLIFKSYGKRDVESEHGL